MREEVWSEGEREGERERRCRAREGERERESWGRHMGREEERRGRREGMSCWGES